MLIIIFLIGVCLFLLYEIISRGWKGFVQWWSGLEELPMFIIRGCLGVFYSIDTFNRYQITGFDQNLVIWIIITLVWFILSIYDFYQLYKKQNYRSIGIGLVWIAVIIIVCMIDSI